MIISLSVLLRMRNFSDTTCRENQNKYFIFIMLLKNLIVYEIWKNMLQLVRAQMEIYYGKFPLRAG